MGPRKKPERSKQQLFFDFTNLTCSHGPGWISPASLGDHSNVVFMHHPDLRFLIERQRGDSLSRQQVPQPVDALVQQKTAGLGLPERALLFGTENVFGATTEPFCDHGPQ